MKIKILQVDIDLGLICDGKNCPVALACNRHFAENDVTVGENIVLINVKKYRLDKIGSKFVRDFDEGKEVSPCEVELI